MNREIEKLGEKDIVIVGFGREGQSIYRFIRKFYPEKPLAIADRNDVSVDDLNITTYTGVEYLDSLMQYDTVFKSPGISDSLPQIKDAKEKGIEVTSQTRLFFAICEGKIIGITGTKGKSTTTSLVHHILTESDLPAVLLGNIGKPCLDNLGDDFGKENYFCFELSSYQLSDLDKSPHIGVFLNIFREHLDYHGSEKAYFKAKSNITRHQSRSDFFVYNVDSEAVAKLAVETKARTLGFSLEGRNGAGVFVSGENIIYRVGGKEESVIDVKKVPLIGKHNLNNIMAAILVAKALNIPTTKIAEAISTFTPLEHRLQLVAKKGEIEFIDDAVATIPEATIAAIRALKGRVGSVILGGTDRGQNFESLARELLQEKVSAVALFPDTGKRIWNAIEKLTSSEVPEHIFVEGMQEAVDFCYKNTPKGKVCLLSTASPSYSVFRDYEDKANHFRQAIANLI
ncbi:MAG: UDP-N-acetylmuramoyl-L-alanine--D-glutamate ligase [Patescibacteria group bacterium]